MYDPLSITKVRSEKVVLCGYLVMCKKKKKKNYSTGFIDWFGWWVLEKGEC